MSLPDIRRAIIDDLKELGLGDAVEPHQGRLSVDELKTLVVKGRAAIKVGCLGIPRVNTLAVQPGFMVAWAVYVMAMDKQGTPRDETAMIIASAVASHVCSNLWGREDLNDPIEIRADNLYSGTFDKRAVALWAVTWRQEWTPETIGISTLDDLLSVVTDFDLDTDSDDEPVLHDTIEL